MEELVRKLSSNNDWWSITRIDPAAYVSNWSYHDLKTWKDLTCVKSNHVDGSFFKCDDVKLLPMSKKKEKIKELNRLENLLEMFDRQSRPHFW